MFRNVVKLLRRLWLRGARGDRRETSRLASPEDDLYPHPSLGKLREALAETRNWAFEPNR